MNSLATNIILNENSYDFIEVEMITLDTFCLEDKIVPDFIKIDVEKIEYDVIKGGINLIKSHYSILSLEIYLNERFRECENILKILKEIRYKIFYINFNRDLIECELNRSLKNKFNLEFNNFVFQLV